MRQVLGSDVPVEDGGFRHGLGVFETVKVERGRALFADWHWESLCEAAEALGLEAPISFPLDLPPGPEGIWRWFHTESGIRATWDEMPPESKTWYSLRVSGICHSSGAWSSRYKTLSYLDQVQARRDCGADEALMINENGQIATAAMANVFWVRDGVVFTPARSCGCRAGVVRRWVLEHGGVECREAAAVAGELDGAREIFLSNSRIGIMPVGDFEGRRLETGPVVRHLQERYSACLATADG